MQNRIMKEKINEMSYTLFNLEASSVSFYNLASKFTISYVRRGGESGVRQ
jgi:hypothetical protein